jgi:hypothetical protein
LKWCEFLASSAHLLSMQDYRKLKVWEKSHAFALDVHRVCGEFPRGDALAIVSQLRRASLSIPSPEL